MTAAHSGLDDERLQLLRQLRDLDDDLEAGKLTGEDHRRLREPVEREAAALLRRGRSPAEKKPAGAIDRSTRRAAPSRRAAKRLTLAFALVGGAAAVAVLLAGAVTPRGADQPISGDAPAAASSAAGAAPQSVTPQQAAEIDAAVAEVKQHPKDVTAHLALAHAYADGGATQLAAVEYLAITRLDPSNAEANTALALLAFEVGRTSQGKLMVDRALAAHPRYPEALYVRALILLMGLHQPAAAKRDLHAYLAVAPFGSHRTAAETLLALSDSEGRK